jgi:hypothetical protein
MDNSGASGSGSNGSNGSSGYNTAGIVFLVLVIVAAIGVTVYFTWFHDSDDSGSSGGSGSGSGSEPDNKPNPPSNQINLGPPTSTGTFQDLYGLDAKGWLVSGSGTQGCIDSLAVNYNPNAETDDGTCFYESGCTNPAYKSSTLGNPVMHDDALCTDDIEAMTLGCTDPSADNYDPNATHDNNTCIYRGCTDPTAREYKSTYNLNDGTCTHDIIGCTDPNADNHEPTATKSGPCTYTTPPSQCADTNASNFGVDAPCEYYGCTDVMAINYDRNALTDDGSCLWKGCKLQSSYDGYVVGNILSVPASQVIEDNTKCDVRGCTDPTATNYDASLANLVSTPDDSMCKYRGCNMAAADNYDATLASKPGFTADNSMCEYWGCTDSNAASGYHPNHTHECGSAPHRVCDPNKHTTCEYGKRGCTNYEAIGYDPTAVVDDGSCHHIAGSGTWRCRWRDFDNVDYETVPVHDANFACELVYNKLMKEGRPNQIGGQVHVVAEWKNNNELTCRIQYLKGGHCHKREFWETRTNDNKHHNQDPIFHIDAKCTP